MKLEIANEIGVETNNKVKEFNVIYANDPNRVEKYNLLTNEVLVYDSGALKGEISDFSINVKQNAAKITISPRTINVSLSDVSQEYSQKVIDGSETFILDDSRFIDNYLSSSIKTTRKLINVGTYTDNKLKEITIYHNRAAGVEYVEYYRYIDGVWYVNAYENGTLNSSCTGNYTIYCNNAKLEITPKTVEINIFDIGTENALNNHQNIYYNGKEISYQTEYDYIGNYNYASSSLLVGTDKMKVICTGSGTNAGKYELKLGSYIIYGNEYDENCEIIGTNVEFINCENYKIECKNDAKAKLVIQKPKISISGTTTLSKYNGRARDLSKVSYNVNFNIITLNVDNETFETVNSGNYQLTYDLYFNGNSLSSASRVTKAGTYYINIKNFDIILNGKSVIENFDISMYDETNDIDGVYTVTIPKRDLIVNLSTGKAISGLVSDDSYDNATRTITSSSGEGRTDCYNITYI